MQIAPMIVGALIIAIVVLAFDMVFLESGNIAYGKPEPPEEEVECSVNSDCRVSEGGMLCIILDNQPPFCGCLDESDCAGSECIDYECRT